MLAQIQPPSNKFRIKGWVPGKYVRVCGDCKEHFIGDKRVVTCSKCAYDEPILIAFTGPPGCGKDFCADVVRKELLAMNLSITSITFADKLHEELRKEYPFWDKVYTTDTKNSRYDVFDGLTPRQVVHAHSKKMCEAHGDKVFTMKSMQDIREAATDVILLTDLGFNREKEELLKYDGQIIVVSIYRAGCDYSGDTRERIEIAGCVINHVNVPGEPKDDLLYKISNAIEYGCIA